ncbi:MAG: hypothetical protein JSS79_05115 [Bacteroidetes bacterium]|nr:hypothetical protein [Bacteroidota bacterium]
MKYKVIIVPSSDDEKLYQRLCDTFDEAYEIMKRRNSKGKNDTAQLFEFETQAERQAFLKGVEVMAGYFGDGLAYQNTL